MAASAIAVGRQALPTGGLAMAVCGHVLGALVLVAMFVGVRRNRPTRRAPWYLFIAGFGMSLIGDVAYSVLEFGLHAEPDWPSWIDAVYLAEYPLLAAGLFILIRGRISGRDRAGLIDASIVATGLGLLCWAFVMRPIFDDQSLGTLARLVSLGYPLGDVLLLVMLARLVTGPGARTASFWLLIGGLVSQLAADTIYAMLSSYEGGPLDLLWSATMIVWGAAALHPSMRSLSEVAPDRAVRFTRWRLALLATTSLLAPAVLAEQGVADAHRIDWPAITIGAVVLFLLVVARMSGLVNQVQDQAVQLAALAHHDGLTGVPNRRAWDLELARAMAAARRSGAPLSVALIDVDHFKRYNDTHGHQAGDALLRDAAAAWRAELRPTDLLARYGGEEFTVLVCGESAATAAAVIDRLRAGTPYGATFSGGVATWDGAETPQKLLGRADAALYEAKRSGRNRVLSAEPAPVVPVG